jgi:hypothetical protein
VRSTSAWLPRSPRVPRAETSHALRAHSCCGFGLLVRGSLGSRPAAAARRVALTQRGVGVSTQKSAPPCSTPTREPAREQEKCRKAPRNEAGTSTASEHDGRALQQSGTRLTAAGHEIYKPRQINYRMPWERETQPGRLSSRSTKFSRRICGRGKLDRWQWIGNWIHGNQSHTWIAQMVIPLREGGCAEMLECRGKPRPSRHLG